MKQAIFQQGVTPYAAASKGLRTKLVRPRAPKPRASAVVETREHKAGHPTRIERKETYLGEAFWQIQPLKNGQPANYQDSDSADTAPQICLKGLNHASYHAVDPPALRNFYTRVLSFKSIERPDFPFDGAWLEGAGLLLHIIQDDPSVPKAINSWKDQFADEPETWFIRRANHLAFEVQDIAAMEERLVFFGIEYTKAKVPGTEAAQLFFYDPEGNGVEVGCDYDTVADALKSSLGKDAAAVSP